MLEPEIEYLTNNKFYVILNTDNDCFLSMPPHYTSDPNISFDYRTTKVFDCPRQKLLNTLFDGENHPGINIFLIKNKEKAEDYLRNAVGGVNIRLGEKLKVSSLEIYEIKFSFGEFPLLKQIIFCEPNKRV